MNAIPFFEHELDSSKLLVIEDSQRLSHLIEVLKAQEGHQLKLCKINGGIGTGLVKKIDHHQSIIQTSDTFEECRTPVADVLIGLSRPPTIKKIVEHGSCLGVGHFHFFQARLSEKSYAQSKVFEQENLQNLMTLGLAQSRYFSQLPTSQVTPYLNLENHRQRKHKFVFCDDGGPMPKISPGECPLLAFGPERGLTDQEVIEFKEAGFMPVSLMGPILRVELAVFTALAQLAIMTRHD